MTKLNAAKRKKNKGLMAFLFLIIFCIVASYSFIILSFYRGWRKIPEFYIPEHSPEIKLSVVIAARNEEATIESLLEDLSAQSYKNFEVIIVDDGSEDNTLFEIKKFSGRLSLKIISKKVEGKKKAILDAIAVSTGELIITTDADCRVPQHWLKTIACYYNIHRPSMIIGPVMMNPRKGFPAAFQQLEFSSLVATAAGATGILRPIMCNGANLIYRKDDFMKMENPLQSAIPSGDDMMLMLNFKKAGKNIHYLKSREALVTTTVESSWKSFFAQRVRWTSKSRFYRDWHVIITAIVVLIYNSALFVTAIEGFFNHFYWILFAAFFTIKVAVDYPILSEFNNFFGQRNNLRRYLPVQLIYPFYIVATGITGNIVPYKWKGRKARELRKVF